MRFKIIADRQCGHLGYSCSKFLAAFPTAKMQSQHSKCPQGVQIGNWQFKQIEQIKVE